MIPRIAEPSTWAGVAVLAVIFGADPDQINATSTLVATFSGLLAILMREGIRS